MASFASVAIGCTVPLLQHDALVAFDDVGEVLRKRERPSILLELRGRDVREELVPLRRRHLRLHVLRVDARVPVELLDDALRLNFRALDRKSTRLNSSHPSI